MRPGRGIFSSRTGVTGVAMILVLVILQLSLIAIVVAGARDVDATMHRVDATRAFYAQEGVVHMAFRELINQADESGDGAIGSIGGGVVSNGPSIGGARAAATASVSGGTTTVIVKGTQNLATRATTLQVVPGSGSVDPVVSYATSTAPAVSATRVYASSLWGSAVNTGTLTGNVCWQTLRTSPVSTSSPARALVTLAQDASLWISQYGGGLWGTASAITAGTGTSNTPVYATEYEGQTGNLMVAYRKGSSTTVYYRTYATATPTEQSFSMGLSAVPVWMEIAGKPGSNELVLLVSSGGTLKAAVWNGAAWGNTTTLENFLPTTGRPFHLAYMRASGAAMVAWTPTTGAPRYATWNGTSWSSAASLPGISGDVPAGWVKLAASPSSSSNELLMACIGTNNRINVNSWSGSAWGTNLTVETAAAASTQARVDVGYQPSGSLGLVVWHAAGQNTLRYRTWSGGAWSAQQSGPNMTSETCTIRLERGYNPGEIMMVARRRVPGYGDYHMYSDNGSFTTDTTTVTPTNASNVSGVNLPAPPAGTSNSNHISPSSGTVAPGTYGTLTHSGTVTFTTGTYIFKSVTINGTMNFDTSAGPITFIVDNGNFSGVNNNNLINTSNGSVAIHVKNGNFDLKNNSNFSGIDIFVYNGNFDCQNNTNGSVNVYASGNITFKNNGTVTTNTSGYGYSSSNALSAVLWTAGSPGARVDLCASMAPAGVCDPCSLAGSPVPLPPTIDSWTAVSP